MIVWFASKISFINAVTFASAIRTTPKNKASPELRGSKFEAADASSKIGRPPMKSSKPKAISAYPNHLKTPEEPIHGFETTPCKLMYSFMNSPGKVNCAAGVNRKASRLQASEHMLRDRLFTTTAFERSNPSLPPSHVAPR